MTDKQINHCDWCGTYAATRIVVYGEQGCGRCAPYMHAAMMHPSHAVANKAIAIARGA